MSLVGNNGTFEISPTVAERHTQFIVKVRDNVMLDYEARKSVIFQVPYIFYKNCSQFTKYKKINNVLTLHI